jgi:hypothetical protein
MSTIEHPYVFIHPNIFRQNDFPARSRLYCLEPQAMGELWQESFTSYLNRLGWTHHVSPRAMIVQEIMPYLNKTQAFSRQWIGSLSRGFAMSLNGVGPSALEWADILEHLTMRADLHLLTLRWWIGNLSSRGHLRAWPAWCPTCYAEWQEQEVDIYQPLLWLFKVVTTCPKHHRLLEDQCPHCQKRQSVIALKTLPGHCTQCSRWLGSSLDEKLAEELSPWQQWVLQTLEELHAASAASGVLQWETFFTHLAKGIPSAANLVTWTQVEHLTGVKQYVFNQWFQQKKIPSLETILQLCYVCEVTPVQIMNGEITSLMRVFQSGISLRPTVPRRARPKVDPARSLELIHAVLDGREKPLGMRQLCKRLGYGHRALMNRFPEECALIVQQAREYRNQQDRLRVEKTREQVRQAVLSLHAQGAYPSLHKVQSFLPAGVMLQPEARETWHAALRELGLESRNPRKTT